LFSWDIVTLIIGQFCTYLTRSKHVSVFKLVGEIDDKINSNLLMRDALMRENVKTHRKIVIPWAIYALFNLYYPVTQVIKGDFSMQFFDSLFRILMWSLLIHVLLTKFLYFFSMLSARLEIVKTCLTEIRKEEMMALKHFMIHEIGKKKVNVRRHSSYYKLMTLKEIYYRCWLLQDSAMQASSFFLLIYFFGYIGQLMNITFFYMKIAILENTFLEHLHEIVLYFTLLNVHTVSFFYASHKIHSKGLKIAGLIHEIAHNGIGEARLVEAVQLFSMQIAQQPMTHINIFGIFYYDRSNINGVRCCEIGASNFNEISRFQILILYSSLFYEAFHINLKIIDLKEKAKELGVSADEIGESSITL
jgi:hypothetical protein